MWRVVMESSRISRPRRGARSVSALYGTLSVVMLAAALVMALIVRPPPPPSIAALGPSPQEQIEEAREDQAAGTGDAALATSSPEETQAQTSTAGDGPSATSTAGPTTTSPDVKVPATRRCFGDPPRQTEDPHSPPCVFEIFEGENGGETAPGVTGTEVRLVVSSHVPREYEEALLDHFNRRYEFYGRRLVIVGDDSDPGASLSPSESAAEAETAISNDPFAVISRYHDTRQLAYHARLAENNIHSIVTLPPNFGSRDVSDGLFWAVLPTLDGRGIAAAEFACESLVGKRARYAGENRLAQTRRKFAITNRTTASTPRWANVDLLRTKLEQCGAEAEEFRYVNETQSWFNTVAELKQRGFTTVISVAGGSDFVLRAMASQQKYFPEWLNIGLLLENYEFNWSRSDSREQSQHAFGITPWVRVRQASEVPACWALEEGGRTCDSSLFASAGLVEELYKGLLVLASGVQAAGPDLTAESFRRALWETDWPNPNPGAPPYWQQRVSFGPGDPTFYDDYAIWWWDEDAPSQQADYSGSNPDNRGSFCYLDRGGRFVPGTFPQNANSRLFHEESCR